MSGVLPTMRFGREICGELEPALRREWLVTNGLGGYASGTIAGVATRRYHGLLVAALTPCVGRTVLFGGAVEEATYDGITHGLSAHEYGGGTIDPHGYRYIESFELDGSMPVWTYRLADALLERRIWMRHGANTTYIQYRLLAASASLHLRVQPLATCRDFHSLQSGPNWQPAIQPIDGGAILRAFDGATPAYLRAEGGAFSGTPNWYWNFVHREETSRGLDDRANLIAAGAFDVELALGDAWTLTLSSERTPPPLAEAALADERLRQLGLLEQARAAGAADPVRRLVLAADQFVVERWIMMPPEAGTPPLGQPTEPVIQRGRSVIAGYHWFNDWGRDTMIALPGLTLATGRADVAAEILRTFARFVRDGLLPNNFPDISGDDPGYNTADATLWYFIALHRYLEVTDDAALIDELLPALASIVEHHIAGTRFGIGMDAADGLLRAGEPGVQLTWMDARVGDWVVTPRTGKPVEINALWYNAIRILSDLLERRSGPDAQTYANLAGRIRASFATRFCRPAWPHLADVVDGPQGDDWTVRPNQIFAVALPYPLIEGDAAKAVVDAVGRTLLTSFGLRSLSPDSPAYTGIYGGNQLQRDGAYHQGPAWNWLLGPYVDAYMRAYGANEAAQRLLQPVASHLADAGLGSVSELMEGDSPHEPRGCIAQAWSVAEALRVWRRLEQPP